MPRAKITPQTPNVLAFEPTTVTPVVIDGVEAPVGSTIVIKTTTNAVVLTLLAKVKYVDGTFKNVTVNVASGKTIYMKLDSNQVKFLKNAKGNVEIDFDVSTGVSVAALAL